MFTKTKVSIYKCHFSVSQIFRKGKWFKCTEHMPWFWNGFAVMMIVLDMFCISLSKFRQNPVSRWIIVMRSLNCISANPLIHKCAAWMIDLAEIQWRGSHELRSTHSLSLLYPVMFCKYVSYYFHSYNYLLWSLT